MALNYSFGELPPSPKQTYPKYSTSPGVFTGNVIPSQPFVGGGTGTAQKRVDPYGGKPYDPIAQNIAGTRPYTPPAGQTTNNNNGSGMPKMPSVEDLFKPLFANLEQQRRAAESRYTANAGMIENIYGQLIGARNADIPVIERAYADLQEAAAARTNEMTQGIATREADRVEQNRQVLASMGVDTAGAAAGDIASEQAQAAQNVGELSGANWENLLRSVGATSQEMARADVSGYGFRQGEDIAQLQAAKEGYFQDLAGQEAQLVAKQEEAKFQQAQAAAQAAAAAAAARARAAQQQQELQYKMEQDAAEAQRGAYENLMKYGDPLEASILRFVDAGYPVNRNKVTAAYDAFVGNQLSVSPTKYGATSWNGPLAVSVFLKSPAAEGLETAEKSIVREAIRNLF